MNNVKRLSNPQIAATDVNESVPSERNLFSLQKNPLLIDTVLQSLFIWVDYATLKNCRLVARKWKDVGDWIFINRSALSIRISTKGLPPTFCNNPEEIASLFKSVDQEVQEVRFCAFKFDLAVLTKPVEEMYLLQNKLRMTQLEITGRRRSPDIDSVTTLNFNINADELIGPNLIKLKLASPAAHEESWTVSLEKLKSLRHIDLKFCKIVVTPGVKMAPKKLKLYWCSLVENSGNPPVSQMNELIDFNSIQKLNFFNALTRYGQGRTTELQRRVVLNWSDLANVKDFTLGSSLVNLDRKISPHKIGLYGNIFKVNGEDNWDILLNHYLDSHSKIEKMILGDKVLFSFDSPMSIKYLEIRELGSFRGTNCRIDIRNLKLHPNVSRIPTDFSLLPKTIESLELDNFGLGNILLDKTCNYIISDTEAKMCLPNLKRLRLYNGCTNILYRFANCPALTCVLIDQFQCKEGNIFQLDHLPRNVKQLFLKDIFDMNVKGSQALKLNFLILSFENGNFDKMVTFFELLIQNQIQPNLVFVHFGEKTQATEREKYISEIMKTRENLMVQNLAFGPVEWEKGEVFENSILFSLTGKKSEYYVFEGQKGIGMSNAEFCKIIPPNYTIVDDDVNDELSKQFPF